MDLDKISEEAARERARDQKRRKKKRWKWPSAKGFRQRSPDSWYVYNRIYPSAMSIFVWIFAVLMSGGICLFVYYLNGFRPQWLLYAGGGLVSLYLLRLLAHWIIKAVRFGAYAGWRKTLPFRLEGWDQLGGSKNFPRNEYWKIDAAVEVQLLPQAGSEAKKLVEDSLFLFTKKANSWFYAANNVQAGSSGDPRSTWKLTSLQSASGSACPGVAGSIYLLVHKQLRKIHEKHGGIVAVRISWGKDLRHVDPYHVDD